MAKQLLVANIQSTTAAGSLATRFMSFFPGDNSVGVSTTNVGKSFKMPYAGVLSRFGISISANTRVNATSFRVTTTGGAPLSQQLSIAAGATGVFEDVVNTDAVSAGDLIACQITNGSGSSGQITLQHRWITIEPASSGKETLGIGYLGAVFTGTTDRGIPFMGSDQMTTLALIPSGSFKSYETAILDRLAVYVSANTATVAVTVTSYINGANGNLVATIAAGSTGFFEDTTHSDTLAIGNTYAFRLQKTGGTGNLTVQHVQSVWTSTGNAVATMGGYSSISQGALGTVYQPLGPTRQQGLTESEMQSKMTFAGRAEKLRVITAGLSASSAADVGLRKNGVTTALIVTLPSGGGGSGTFENTTDIVSFADGDLMDFIIGSTPGDASWLLYLMTIVVGEGAPVSLSPDRGQLQLHGQAATLTLGQRLSPARGQLELHGQAPTLVISYGYSPDRGQLVIQGLVPRVKLPGTTISQHVQYIVEEVVPDISLSQEALYVVGQVNPAAVVAQSVQYIVSDLVPGLKVPQSIVYLVCDAVPCVTHWQQLWTITRKDGVVLRYTSLDEDFTWGLDLYKHCNSLSPSASESATEIGSVGNQELKGILDDEGISDEDMLAGKYDDAYVEVWLVPWEGNDSARRIAAGWTGTTSRGDYGYELEVVGPSSRLEQQALIQVYTPGCRWEFGDPGTCKKDIEPLKLLGEVLGAKQRDKIFTVLEEPGGSSAASDKDVEWPNGRIRWTSGRNLGTEQEIKSVDFATGLVTLWVMTPFKAEAGDTFDLLPGCSRNPDACKGYGNYINYGGYPDVPGQDDMNQTPDAKY